MAINATDSPSQTRRTQETQAPAPKAETAAKPEPKPAETAEAKKDVSQGIVDGARKAAKGLEDALKAKLGNLLGDDGLSGRQFAGGTGKKGTRGGIRTVMNNGPTGPNGTNNTGNIALAPQSLTAKSRIDSPRLSPPWRRAWHVRTDRYDADWQPSERPGRERDGLCRRCSRALHRGDVGWFRCRLHREGRQLRG